MSRKPFKFSQFGQRFTCLGNVGFANRTKVSGKGLFRKRETNLFQKPLLGLETMVYGEKLVSQFPTKLRFPGKLVSQLPTKPRFQPGKPCNRRFRKTLVSAHKQLFPENVNNCFRKTSASAPKRFPKTLASAHETNVSRVSDLI